MRKRRVRGGMCIIKCRKMSCQRHQHHTTSRYIRGVLDDHVFFLSTSVTEKVLKQHLYFWPGYIFLPPQMVRVMAIAGARGDAVP